MKTELPSDCNSEGMFITVFEGVMDLVAGEFTYVNAGHEVPYIQKKGQIIKRIR